MSNVSSDVIVKPSKDSKEPAAGGSPKPGSSVPWNPWLAVAFMVVIFYASQVIGGLLVSIYPAIKHWTSREAGDWLNGSVTAQFVFIVIAEAVTIGAVYLFLKRYKQKFSSIGLLRPRIKDFVAGAIAAPVYYLLFVVVVSIASALLTGLNVDQKQEIGFDSVHGIVQLTMTFISLAVLPPLAEEILVRGFLYTSLKKAMPKIGAVLLTSAIFAAAHLPEGGASGPLYIAAIDTFTLSLVLIYLREKTGSLWASITLHAIKNSIAFFALFVFTSH
jgi:membrane protease YdiL (CAAX protease family)